MSDIVSVTDKTPVADVKQQSDYDKVAGIAGLLGLDTPTDEEKGLMVKIGDYFRSQEKELSEIDLLNKVRQLEMRLGAPAIGESRLNQVYRYVSIIKQRSDLDKQLEKLSL